MKVTDLDLKIALCETISSHIDSEIVGNKFSIDFNWEKISGLLLQRVGIGPIQDIIGLDADIADYCRNKWCEINAEVRIDHTKRHADCMQSPSPLYWDLNHVSLHRNQLNVFHQPVVIDTEISACSKITSRRSQSITDRCIASNIELVEYDEVDELQRPLRIRGIIDKKRKFEPNISDLSREDYIREYLLPKLCDMEDLDTKVAEKGNESGSTSTLSNVSKSSKLKVLCEPIPVGFPQVTMKQLDQVLKKEADAQMRKAIKVEQTHSSESNSNSCVSITPVSKVKSLRELIMESSKLKTSLSPAIQNYASSTAMN